MRGKLVFVYFPWLTVRWNSELKCPHADVTDDGCSKLQWDELKRCSTPKHIHLCTHDRENLKSILELLLPPSTLSHRDEPVAQWRLAEPGFELYLCQSF